MVSDDLKWEGNTQYICKKARKKIFLLRSMKMSGLSLTELVDAYTKEIRSILELAVPVWNFGLTLEQSMEIERVQKAAISVILGLQYTTYDEALEKTRLERLSSRRRKICSKYITKNMNSDQPLLEKVNKKSHFTRSNPGRVIEFQCRTKTFYDSSLPSLARLYNQNLKVMSKT